MKLTKAQQTTLDTINERGEMNAFSKTPGFYCASVPALARMGVIIHLGTCGCFHGGAHTFEHKTESGYNIVRAKEAAQFDLIYIRKSDEFHANGREYPMGWYYKIPRISPAPHLCGPFKSVSKARDDFNDTYNYSGELGDNRCECGLRIPDGKEFCAEHEA